MKYGSLPAAVFVCLGVGLLGSSPLAAQQQSGAPSFRHSGSGSPATAAADPGPRGGSAGAGGPLQGLGSSEMSVFNSALPVFMEVDSVSGNVPGEEGSGLGPTFN